MLQGLYQSNKDNECGLTTHIGVGQKGQEGNLGTRQIFPHLDR